jgi:hypothetical protein
VARDRLESRNRGARRHQPGLVRFNLQFYLSGTEIHAPPGRNEASQVSGHHVSALCLRRRRTALGAIALGTNHEHDSIWLQLSCLSLAGISFIGWPRTITLDEIGISQRSLFGVRRSIPFSDIQYVSYDSGKETTYVVGSQTTMQHTADHSDRALFQELLEEHTGKEILG